MRGSFGIARRLMAQLYSCKRSHRIYTKAVFHMAIIKKLTEGLI
jgi:hypothetical protein